MEECEACGAEGQLVQHHWSDRDGEEQHRQICRVCNALLIPRLFLHYLTLRCYLPPWETQRRAVRHVRGVEIMPERQARAILCRPGEEGSRYRE